MIAQTQALYRPYLSAADIAEILTLLPKGELQAKLKLYQFKIQEGIISPSHLTVPKLSTLEKLGGTSPEEQRYMNGEMLPEEEEEYLNNLMSGTHT